MTSSISGVDTNLLQSLGVAEKPAATKNTNSLNQDMFLQLMITQMKNQNPLNPQDGAQFLAQLAQFSQVTGLQDLNKSFSDLKTSMTENQSLQAASLVGKNVLVASDKALLGGSGGVMGNVTAPDAASNVTLSIVNDKGVTVRSIDLGILPAGQSAFSWDGLTGDGVTRAEPGTYTLKVEGLVGGQTTALTSEVSASVNSVTLGGANGINVDLGALGKFAFKDVQAIS